MSSISSTSFAMPTRSRTKTKYIKATAASSTAALAASNTARNYATATTYLQTALEAITKTAAGEMDADTCAAILAPCLVGAETAASEATEAVENARAAAEIAEEAASDATKADYVEASEWASDDSSVVDINDVSVLDDKEFETESVLAEWTALKDGRARSSGEEEDDDEEVDYDTPRSTSSWTSLDALAHAEANEAQYPVSIVVGASTENPPPKTCWGFQTGVWADRLLTRKDNPRAMYAAYGEITEILLFRILVVVEPTDEILLSDFQRVSLSRLRGLAQITYAPIPEVGEISCGFRFSDRPGDALRWGFGKVVNVGRDERICLVRNWNEGVGTNSEDDLRTG
ncbi:hypothetical protein BDV10DRAFT_185148 [Aspergillus recurvatus]